MMQASLDTLTVSHRFAAPPERVFRAWTTADEVRQWFGRLEGVDIPHVEMDARVGGRYRIEYAAPGDVSAAIVGTFKEVSPERLVYTFAWEEPRVLDEMDTGETLVTVRFNEVDGGTEVVLVHEQLRGPAVVAFHETGWASGWTRLEELLRSEGGGR